MKRYIIAALALFASLGLGAQNMYDAYRYSATDYLGTARVVGLGGAVTAVGSDLGTISYNPAGSAVARYSQFSFSPSLSTSMVNSAFVLDPSSNPQPAKGLSNTSFRLPNMGMTTRLDLAYDSSSAITFGFLINSTYDYNYAHRGSGLNSYSSKFADLARAAEGISNEVLGSDDFYFNADYTGLWDVAMAYKSGLINAYGPDGHYVGCSEVTTEEGLRFVPSDLMQRSEVFTSGSKNDMIFNMAFDFNNKFYLGLNLGMPFFEYSNMERFSEVAQVVEDFPIKFIYDDGSEENTFFDNAIYQYNYSAQGAGVYAKFGLIWLPAKGLRLGLAYQTPTMMDISETWVHSGKVVYDNGSSYSARSRTGSYDYSIITPHHFDFGLAYTIANRAMVSVDYSLENYSSVKIYDSYDDGYYDLVNAATSAFSGLSHSLRAGVEFRLGNAFALRAGANFITSAEKYYTSAKGNIYYSDYNDDYYLGRKVLPNTYKYVKDIRASLALGLGYNDSSSPFYADFAVRYAKLPGETYQPYYDYDDVYSPIFQNSRSLINAVLTLGWKF
ncbi:MAG: hypothetical protein ACI3ZF_00575 [Candidatus Cryptobacteroides sp.]